MYVIRRTHKITGRNEFWSNDTAREFWHGAPSKRWMKAFVSKRDALSEYETVKANYTHLWWTYSVIDIPYTLAERQKYMFAPLDNTVEDQRNSV